MNTRTLAAVALISIVGYNYARPGSEASASSKPELAVGRTEESGQRAVAPIPDQDLREAIETAGPNPEFAIATVPDPDTTPLRIYTDRVLDMLQLAAYQNDYVLTKFWIPWRISLERPDDRYKQRKEQMAEARHQALYPGAMVFRKGSNFLVILLVPETPTYGIDPAVLGRALEVVTSRKKTAPMIGPSFTAGVLAVDRWFKNTSPQDRDAISRFVFTTVTGISQKRRREIFADKQVNWVCSQQEDTGRYVRNFLTAARGEGRSDVVILAEDSTGFSREVAQRNGGRTGPPILFPWQISRLRSALPEQGAANDREQRGGSNLFSLPLQLRESRRPMGSLPTYAAGQTPAVQEAILTQISERLDQRTEHFISIIATDVLDSIFLARLLGQANPNQRLITLEPDLMLMRSQDVMPAAGILAPATFPTSNHLRLKSESSEPAQFTFDGEFSQAVYTAAFEAIGNPNRCSSNAKGPLQERPVWMMVLGKNGYWPVARIDDRKNVPTELEPDRPSLVWILAFQVTAGVALLWLIVLLGARFQPTSRLLDFAIAPQWPGSGARTFSITALTTAITGAYVANAAPLWARYGHGQHPGWTAAFWIGLIALTAAAYVPWAGASRLAKRVQIAAGIIATTPLAVTLFLRFRSVDDPRYIWTFFLRRSQDYLNGVSPLLPVTLLLLGFVGCAWSCHFSTVISTERYIHLGGLPGRPHRYLAVFHPKLAVLAILFGIGILLTTQWHFHTFEMWKYDWLYRLLLSALVACTLHSTFSFLAQWLRLRRFLDGLELHPIRFALSAMPKMPDESAIWEAHPRRRSFVFYSRAVDCLRRLAWLDPVREDVRDAIAAVREFLGSTRKGIGDHRGRIEDKLGVLAATFESELNKPNGPWMQGSSELKGMVRDTSDVDRLKEEFLIHRLSAFLRSAFLHLRNRLTAMSAGFIAITLSLKSYPFGQERMLEALTLLLLATLVSSVALVFAQIHRNPTLTRMSAESGKLDMSYWSKLISASALPLLSIMASYTPAVGRFIGSWLQPALQAMGK